MIEHGGQPSLFCFVSRQNPGLCFIDVFIASLEEGEDFCEGVRHPQFLHLFFHLIVTAAYHLLQVVIHIPIHAAVFDQTAKIFIAHRNGTIDEISQRIGEVGIITLRHQLPGDHAVIFIGHFMQHKIAHRIHPEEGDQIVGIDHVSLGLGHFFPAL